MGKLGIIRSVISMHTLIEAAHDSSFAPFGILEALKIGAFRFISNIVIERSIYSLPAVLVALLDSSQLLEHALQRFVDKLSVTVKASLVWNSYVLATVKRKEHSVLKL